MNEIAIRKGIDCVGVTVVYLCHDGNGKILLAKRSNNARDEHGAWDIGGGGLDLHDTVENTLKKEIGEEYCARILNYEFLGYRDVHRVYNGNKTHWIALDFKVLIDPNSVKNGEPHKFEEVKWFDVNNLPTPLHSQLPTFFRKYNLEIKKLKNRQSTTSNV